MNSRNLLLQILMLDAGIVPDVDCDDHKSQEDVFGFTGWYDKPKTLDGYLASISPAEKKLVQRRFRKLWRKACKRYGLDPKRLKDKASRRRYVKKMLLEDSRQE
jgi:hypothetical protein